MELMEKQRAEALDKSKWASEFTWPDIKALSAYMQVQKIPKDAAVCLEGDNDNSLLIIVDGAVKILKKDAHNNMKVIARLGPCESLGEMSLIDGKPRSATVVAIEDCVLLKMSEISLEKMIRDQPELAIKLVMKLARFLSQRLRDTSDALATHLKINGV